MIGSRTNRRGGGAGAGPGKRPGGRAPEPYGFSRDALGSMGPPDVNDAAFAVDGDATRMTIQLNGAQPCIGGIFLMWKLLKHIRQ